MREYGRLDAPEQQPPPTPERNETSKSQQKPKKPDSASEW
jgi:hypothetical protein